MNGRRFRRRMNPTVSGWQEASGETERRKLDGKIFSIFSINHKMKCLRNVGFHSKDFYRFALGPQPTAH